MEKRNSQIEPPNLWIKQEACLHVRLRCGSLSITTPVSLLANEFGVRSKLHWQVSLAAVNQSCVIHEAINGCKIKIESEYDQEIPQSQTADNPVATRGRAAQPSQDTRKTN